MLLKVKCNERNLSRQTLWLNEATMTAGGVEDTALHYKREISAVVKKTTSLARQKRFRTCVTFLRMSPLDVGPASARQSPIASRAPFAASRITGLRRCCPHTVANPTCQSRPHRSHLNRSSSRVGEPRRAVGHPVIGTLTRRNFCRHATRSAVEARRAWLHAPVIRLSLIVKPKGPWSVASTNSN